MWLLSTDRAELRYFNSPDDVPGGYAILSHVWGPKEQSFQETRALQLTCSTTGDNPRDLSSEKVKESCILAQEHGYQWIWNDTCCIDKTSSAELSEAINSMFRYYSLSDVCYAYLQDVPQKSDLVDDSNIESSFQLSRWHERGWTLQELIAPPYVLFLNTAWQVLGSKADLAYTLEEVTRIPVGVLRMEVGVEEISVATRMSWAAKRQTTRPEDEAYCLLGVFSINMPTLYGEGRYAFQRLQEEIMKNFPDTALFAWGRRWEYSPDEAEISQRMARVHLLTDDSYLFAPAPSAFRDTGALVHIMPTVKEDRSRRHLGRLIRTTDQDHVGIPTLTITPHGVRAHIPIVQQQGFTVAVFSWFKDDTQLGLILTPSPASLDPRIRRYNIGVSTTDGGHRLVSLGNKSDSFELFGNPVHVQWQEVYLAHRPQPGMQPELVTRAARILMSFSMNAPFRFLQANLAAFISNHGNIRPQMLKSPMGWTGAQPLQILFAIGYGGGWRPGFELSLGRCAAPSGTQLPSPKAPPSSDPLGPHWARINVAGMEEHTDPRTPPSHSCETDHICDWPDLTKTIHVDLKFPLILYRPARRPFMTGLTMSFTPYELHRDHSALLVKLIWDCGQSTATEK